MQIVCNVQHAHLVRLSRLLCRIYDRADVESEMHAIRSALYETCDYYDSEVTTYPFPEVVTDA